MVRKPPQTSGERPKREKTNKILELQVRIFLYCHFELSVPFMVGTPMI